MSMITWVGINHYVEDAHLEDFYASLNEGDVVSLVPEPDNYWDENAIAVYYNFLMRGYISRHETENVHLMRQSNLELVGRVTDDIDPELNQVKITVDSVSAPATERADYPRLEDSVLGVEMKPHIMFEEVSYKQIRESVDHWVRMIKKNDLEPVFLNCAISMITKAMDAYFSIWNHSISEEANKLPRYFDDMLTDVSKIDVSVMKALKPLLKKLRLCTHKQPKDEHSMSTLRYQAETLEKHYSEKKGFYEDYDKMFAGKKQELKKRLEAIDKWLKQLTASKNCMYSENFNDFAHLVYCLGFRAKELYTIITHLVLMRHIMTIVFGIQADTDIAVIGNLYDELKKKKVVVEKKNVHVHMEGGTFVKEQYLSKV